MKWGRLAADFYTDDKLEELRHSEAYLFLKLVAWSVGHETAGRIPPSALRTATSLELCSACVT